MLVSISTTFLTLVFLAFYTAVASASPTSVSPNNIARLLPREVPADSLCGNMEWLWRECYRRGGERAYRDICLSHNLNIHLPVRTNCPEDHKCQDGFDMHGDQTITCIPLSKKGKDEMVGPIQAGSSTSKQGIISPSQDMRYQVFVITDMKASVTAILVSEKEDFILTPAQNIVGKLHGSDRILCQGVSDDQVKGSECYPTGSYYLSKGNQIDFTWGMKNAQKGSLQYALIPPIV